MKCVPLVSVIISLYNKEKYIASTIGSVLNQTYSNIEVIVVDDGSTDNGPAIVKEIVDNRVKLYSQTNKGPGAAQNLGFSFSSGFYVKFLDADDILTHEVIENQVELLKDRDKSICYLEWEKFQCELPDKRNIRNTIHKDCLPIDYLTHEGKLQMLQSGQFLIPRSLLDRAGLWNENLTLINDTEFYTRLFLSCNKLIFCNKGVLFYRVIPNTSSVSQVFSRGALQSAIVSIDLSTDYLLHYEQSERVFNLAGRMYQMVLEWTYPKFTDLTRLLENRYKKVPKEFWKPTVSGIYFNLFLKLFGWKFSRHAQLGYYKIKSI